MNLLALLKIGTAAAAFMSIRVLLDHGIREDHIIFITLLVARGGGVSVLRRAFPKVKIVCGGVDEEMQEGWLEGYKGEGNPEGIGRKVWIMKPGMGQIGLYTHRHMFVQRVLMIYIRKVIAITHDFTGLGIPLSLSHKLTAAKFHFPIPVERILKAYSSPLPKRKLFCQFLYHIHTIIEA